MTIPNWVIQKEWASTICDDRHPVRLGRKPEHYPDECWERRLAINEGRKGYLCPGGMEHDYPIWVVFDAADDRKPNAGVFDVYAEAVACVAKLRAADAALAEEGVTHGG